MRRGYLIKSDTPTGLPVAIADVMPAEEEGIVDGPTSFPGWWYVSRISVPKALRGKGIGTKLLMMICEDADADKITLYLTPVPSDPQFGFEVITRWYMKHGFEWDASGISIMVRRPR